MVRGEGAFNIRLYMYTSMCTHLYLCIQKSDKGQWSHLVEKQSCTMYNHMYFALDTSMILTRLSNIPLEVWLNISAYCLLASDD